MYEHGNYWYQNLGEQSFKIYNPIKQNQSHISYLDYNVKSVRKLPIINLIVFSNNATLNNKYISRKDVHIINKEDLIDYIEAYERILKNNFTYTNLETIKDDLIEMDLYSSKNLNIHINGIKERVGSKLEC